MEENGIKPDALDQNWYSRFEQAGSFQVHEYLDGDKEFRTAQRSAFEAGTILNPSLDYPKIDVVAFEKREQDLLGLKRDVIAGEPNEVVKQVYRWRINEKLAELRMLKISGQLDQIRVTREAYMSGGPVEGAATAEELEEAEAGLLRKFRKYNEFVYCNPSPEVFSYTVQKVRAGAEADLNSDSVELQEAARNLLSKLPEVQSSSDFTTPSQEDFNAAKENTMQTVGELLDLPEFEGELVAEEIRQAFDIALQSLEAEGWKVTISTDSKTAISVDQETREVKIPSTRKLGVEKLRSLIAHEVGTHVARRVNGERGKLMILGLGLDRYEKGDEGVATMREQVLSEGISDFSGLEGHLAISLATGLDGTPRNFRQTYEVLEAYFYHKSLRGGKAPEVAKKDAKTQAWTRAVRTFRGTSENAKGVAYTKDIVYREGNIGVWNVVREDLKEMLRLNVGKYDPANPRHIWVLNQLGITEEDLDHLES